MVRNFAIIGEASKQYRGLKRQYLQIPWKQITGMRNKVIHEYCGVDLETVWKAISEDLPELEKQIHAIHKELKRNQ